jgi:type II secretory pathway pseudopilin PulG
MSTLSFSIKRPFLTVAANVVAIEIDGVSSDVRVSEKMERPLSKAAAFSLVEVTLALGVAAFCLVVLLGLFPATLKTQQSSIQQTTANQIISQITSVLRADVRLPPGQANKVCPDPPDPNEPCDWGSLHGHWRDVAAPDTLDFTNEGRQTGTISNQSPPPPPPPDAVFRATITYRFPPSDTTSLADIRVTWSAKVDPDDPTTGVPAGSVTSLIAVNR